jgi:PPOX class probable F420-dependent enzyme
MALDLNQFGRAKYVALVTYRRSGDAVSTPVWFAVDADAVFVWTEGDSGKVKRLRNNPSCTVALCDMRGRVTGPHYDAKAHLLSETDGPRVHALLNAKYGLAKKAVERWNGLWSAVRRRPGSDAFIEIRLMR